MDFALYTDVVLTEDLPAEKLRAGDVGTVVERHDVAGKEPGYSVEFFDMLGKTVAVVTVPCSKIRAPAGLDMPSVRTLAVSRDFRQKRMRLWRKG